MGQAQNHEIPELGTIRAHNGTALETVAGAAKYWHDKYSDLAQKRAAPWRDGFMTGSVATLIITALGFLSVRFLF